MAVFAWLPEPQLSPLLSPFFRRNAGTKVVACPRERQGRLGPRSLFRRQANRDVGVALRVLLLVCGQQPPVPQEADSGPALGPVA